MMTLIEKKISMPYPKKYSKSPSVVHSIRASCENAAMFSCKKYNLTGRVPTSNSIIYIHYKKIYIYVYIFFQFFFCTMERDSACEVIQENIAAFSQLALIACTTDWDYFFRYSVEIFFQSRSSSGME